MFGFSAVTINMRGRSNRWPERRHLLVGQLVDTQPDIVALQELDLSLGQGAWLTRQVNIRLTGNSRRPYRTVHARRSGLRHYFEGVGVMTRLPIIYHDSLAFEFDGRVAIRVNVELPAGAAGTRRQSLDFVSVQLHHGAAAGSPEASCFAAALTPPRFGPGPGTLIHLIKSKSAESEPAP